MPCARGTFSTGYATAMLGAMGKSTRRNPHELIHPEPVFANPFGALKNLRESLPAGASPEPDPEPEPASHTTATAPDRVLPRCGKIVVRREKKGRAGKTVTCVEGLPAASLAPLAKQLKTALGCAASREGETLVLHGALVERTTGWLIAHGARQVVS